MSRAHHLLLYFDSGTDIAIDSPTSDKAGVDRVTPEVAGVPAHTGIEPEKGVNAIEELAVQVLAVKLLEDAASGTTVQAGLISGGVAKNAVARSARAEIDVRVATPAEWARVETAVLHLRPRNPKARLRIEAALTHPPIGSDGSYCAALGVPLLDGLGVEGEGAHAVTERVRVDRIAPRAAFLALILETAEGA